MTEPMHDTFPRIRRGMTVWHVNFDTGDVLDVPVPSHAKVRWRESGAEELVPVGTLTVIRDQPARPYARGLDAVHRDERPSRRVIVAGAAVALLVIVVLVAVALMMASHVDGELPGVIRSAALSASVSDRTPVRASSATEPANASPAPRDAATSEGSAR
jgi:hypothetical protein